MRLAGAAAGVVLAAAATSAPNRQSGGNAVIPSWRSAARDLPSVVKTYHVYMMTNDSRVVLYIGVTSDLERCVWEHQHGEIEGFTKRYRLRHLVFHESFQRIEDAIRREKELKAWRRSKKDALIERMKRRWDDLSVELFKRL